MINEGANPPGRSSGYVDINCHILPGLDDGATDLRTSIGMLKIAYEEGIRTIIATPDYRRQYKETDMDKLKAVFERVKNEAAKISPDLRLYFGREIFYDNDAHEKIVSGEISSLAKSRYVMLEFPVDIDYETIAEAIRDISMDGYIPIVSHVETYSCLDEDEDMVEDLIKLGAYIQVDSGSVMGENGHDIRNFARKLVKNEMQFSNNQAVNAKFASDPNFGNAFLGGQNDTAIYVELAKNIVFENHTIYDQLINEDMQKCWREYCDGDVSEEQAMANFYAMVSESYPTIVTP